MQFFHMLAGLLLELRQALLLAGKLEKKIKRKLGKNEINGLEENIKINEEHIKHLKSGKSIGKILLNENGTDFNMNLPVNGCDIESIASEHDGGKDYNPDWYNIKYLDKPEIRKKIIADLEKNNERYKEKLKNKNKKTETYKETGSAIGSWVGGGLGAAGVALLRRNKK